MNKKFLFIIIIFAIVIYFFNNFLPSYKANKFFKELDKREGFTMLVDDELLSLSEKISQNISFTIDRATGYKIYESYKNINFFDFIEIYDCDGNFIAEGYYRGYWSSDVFTRDYHIIDIQSFEKSKTFKIDSSKVCLKLTN